MKTVMVVALFLSFAANPVFAQTSQTGAFWIPTTPKIGIYREIQLPIGKLRKPSCSFLRRKEGLCGMIVG